MPALVHGLLTALVIGVAGLAVWHDVRTRQIPNRLTLAGLGAALLLQAPLGLPALGQAVAGAAVALALGFGLFALGLLGGGDAKLLALTGALFGPVEFFWAFGLIAVLGAIIALLDAARRGLVPLLVIRTLDAASLGRPVEAAATLERWALVVPYGIAIGLGTLIWWFQGGFILARLLGR